MASVPNASRAKLPGSGTAAAGPTNWLSTIEPPREFAVNPGREKLKTRPEVGKPAVWEKSEDAIIKDPGPPPVTASSTPAVVSSSRSTVMMSPDWAVHHGDGPNPLPGPPSG